jgi:hypothetical protein
MIVVTKQLTLAKHGITLLINFFLPSADYEEVAKGLGITFCTLPQTLLKSVTKSSLMTHLLTNDTWNRYLWQVWHMTQVWHPWHVSQCDTITQKSYKNTKICKKLPMDNWNRCDTFWHFDTSVTPKVFKFNRPSKDCRKHSSGTYLLDSVYIQLLHLIST